MASSASPSSLSPKGSLVPEHATRRSVLIGMLAASASIPGKGRAEADGAFDISGDDGRPVMTMRLPVELSPSSLPGIVWVGSATPDVTLIEFFDYNCPFCRKAASDLDALVARDKELRLGLINNAILGIGSIQAAKVQQAVLKLYGPERANNFHKALFARRGLHDGASALQVSASLGLNEKDVRAAADGADVTSVLTRQAKMAEALGLVATPSFEIGSVGILGYPGSRTVAKMIASVRACEKPAC